MKKQKILYAITNKDVINVSKQEGVSFTMKDLPFIQGKVEDYFGDKWQGAIAYALEELRNK